MQNCHRTVKFFPIWGWNVRYFGALNWLKCLGGILHLKPTAGCQISTLLFGFVLGILCISHEKMTKNSKVLSHLRFNSRVLPEPLTDIGAWVAFCTFQAHSRLSNIYFDICIFFLGETLYISHENFQQTTKFCPSWGLDQRYCPGL